MHLRRFCCLVAASLLFAAAGPSRAVTLGFGCITGNIAGDCAIGEAQMTVYVTDPGGGQIDFTFENVGADASSITDVFWDDGSLLAIFSITNTLGVVEFSDPATPAELPGANNASPPFVTSVGFSADSDPPAQPLGVNPGEMLLVRFDLIGGQTFADALSELADDTLRVGIHVQGFATGGSESFVTPEPGTLAPRDRRPAGPGGVSAPALKKVLTQSASEHLFLYEGRRVPLLPWRRGRPRPRKFR